MLKKQFYFLSVLLCLCNFQFVFAQISDTLRKETDSLRNYIIEENVVTGTRTVKRIIDVPYSVLRVEGAQYKYERKTSVDDVLGNIPGLFLQSRYGNHDVRISMRGFGSRSNSGIRGVRILLDGIPESEPDGQTRIEAIDFQSVGKIEVVKGNASSLYTNAPGGVINFINDITFENSFFKNFNEFGSFDLRSNGMKTGVHTASYNFLGTYNYHNAKGYRPHSEDYWHIVNSVLETTPAEFTHFNMYFNYVSGFIRLPGSLTKEQFDADPFQPNVRDIARDSKRITKKGRVGLRFETFFGENRENELELTAYGTMKYFERTAKRYRILSRDGIGASGRFVHNGTLFNRNNEFSIGGDLFHQTGPIEEYDNINGLKGDPLLDLFNETIGNAGMYFQNSVNLYEEKCDLLFTGRYDKVVFDSKNQQLSAVNSTLRFEKFTPKFSLNYKLLPTVAAYTSYGFSYDTPAFNELDNYPTSSQPTVILNPDLQAQKSRNFEIGLKGNLLFLERQSFRTFFFEATFFNSKIEDEIVPFEVFGDVYYRNSASTNRTGWELGAETEVLHNLQWKTAYTFSNFTYDAYTARAVDINGNISDKNYSGNGVPSVPKHNITSSLAYEHYFNEHVTGFIKGNIISISGMFTDDENSEVTQNYQLLSSLAGCDVALGNFNMIVSGGINNMMNKTYVAFININSASKEFYEAGEPRNYFGSINFNYNL
ncbi:MAG: TonB-dependent receptor [Bacteroidota bacterium]